MERSNFILVACLIACLFISTGYAEAEERHRPVIAGEWRVLYQPEAAGSRVNDHTIFLDADGNWRFIGIAAKWGRDLTTPYLGHAVGYSLEEPMRELPVIFRDYPDRKPKWAPHVVERDGTWHLFCGPGKIRHYTSPNGVDWTFHDIAITPGWPFFRDSMVLKITENEWAMYCTDRSNTVSVYRSADLYRWRFVGVALKAKKPATAYPWWMPISSTESPFVIHYKGVYYLSVCLTSALEPDSYSQTIVVSSENPYDFGVYSAGGPDNTANLVTVLPAHAAEYILTPEGKWYITGCGWKSYPGVEGKTPGAVVIAPLEWGPLSDE